MSDYLFADIPDADERAEVIDLAKRADRFAQRVTASEAELARWREEAATAQRRLAKAVRRYWVVERRTISDAATFTLLRPAADEEHWQAGAASADGPLGVRAVGGAE